MAKFKFKPSMALLTSALLLAAFPGTPGAAAGTADAPASLADLLNPARPLILSSGFSGPESSGSPARMLSAAAAPAVVDPNIDTSSSDKISVIVQLSGQAVSEAKHSASLSRRSFSLQSAEQSVVSEQSAFKNTARVEGIAMKVNYQYDTVLNGMEITVRADQIPALAQLAGVKSISLNSTYYPIPLIETPADENGSGPNIEIDPLAQIGVDTAWQSGYTGKGVKVGVIDTGVDYLHPDLKNAYKGGYDSFYQDNDPYEEIPAIFGFEGTSHGTHVAGTIVGRAENKDSEVVQKGIAYEADLYAYKVLGATYNESKGIYETSGTSAQVIDGIEHAVKDGMDVINLSLGSDMEKDPDSPDSIAVNNAVLSGVVAVVANGNAGADGKYYYSMGSPASSQLAISVAAATSTSTHYRANFSAQLTNTVTEEVYSVTDMVYSDLLGWSYNGANFGELLGTEPVDAVYAGLGDYIDYSNVGDVTGKVVIVSRGNLTFVDKVAIAKSHGAKALILFNGNSLGGSEEADLSESIPGRDGPIGDIGYLGDDYAFIPTFDMPGIEGRALARTILEHPDQPLHITFGKDYPMTLEAGDTIADFSSRGPNSDDNYGIKPDISAPGVNILSTLPEYAAYYGNPEYSYYFDHGEPSYGLAYHRSSGTSMASPHIAGLAALMTQAHPGWTPLEIRAALANTADEISDQNGTPYDVYSQGAGRADVADALITPAVVQSLDPITVYDDKMNASVIQSEASSLSFGAIDPGAAALSKPLRIKNLSGDTVTYTASVVMHPSVTSDPSDPIPTPDVNNIVLALEGLGAGSTITAEPGASTPFALTARATDQAAHGVYEGEILLQGTGLPSLHLPFVIHVGDDAADNDFGLIDGFLTHKRISPSTPADLSVTLANDHTNFMVVEVNGLDGEYIGRISEWYDLNAETQELAFLPEGRVTFENIDGSYTDGTVDEYGNYVIKQLEPGQYKLSAYAVQYDESFEIADVQSVNLTFYMMGEDEGGASEPTPSPTPTPAPGNTGGGGGVSATPSPTASSAPSSPAAPPLAAVVEPNQTLASLTGVSTPDGDQTVITLSNDTLMKALEVKSAATVYSVTAATADHGTQASLKLTAGQVDLLQSAPAGSSLAFSWNGASLSIPLSALSGVAANADLTVSIMPDANSKAAFNEGYAALLGTPYTFEAYSTAAGVTTKVTFAPDQIVHRAFLLDKGIDASDAGVLYIEAGDVYPVPARFKTLPDGSTLVIISRPGFSTYAAATRTVEFTDIRSSWAKDQIQLLSDKFLLNGTSEDTFQPKSPVTRAQFASMLVTAIGLDRSVPTNAFTDIKGSEWYARDVNAAYRAGLITGYAGTFRPNDEITRQDLTVMLARAIKLLDIQFSGGAVRKPYADAAAFSSYAKDSIQAVSDAGLMQGEGQQGQFLFHPALPTTREAAGKVLYQLLSLAGSI
ncbi:S8 family serine peptidase [Paenibacillus sp. NFR01]|uniref:S8 family serine peptidase n=1 Tax=Paenibacillus sp. NFR01 TaxID=1566279 RepID=UPI0008C2F3B9|nr:S8 family serine peptidase [Paenibacillus sp. NFR01]SET60798.1 Serine protease, subtilisin family [Paenibacillus sp. NFR01]